MPRKPVIEIHNLSTGYVAGGRRNVVSSGINETLFSGELTCLLGPNGAGKSTLLKTLAGFLNPLNGEIDILGRSSSLYTPRELARIIGVVLTDRIFSSNISVIELVTLGRSPYTGFWGKTTKEDNLIAENALNLTGVADLASRKVVSLSDGERQKVMIAKALAQQTPVIFLDEPTAFLDYPSKVEILRLLHNLAESEQLTVFLSTHDLEIALQISDTLWLMDKNLGLTTGTTRELADNGDIARYFDREGIFFDPENLKFNLELSPVLA